MNEADDMKVDVVCLVDSFISNAMVREVDSPAVEC